MNKPTFIISFDCEGKWGMIDNLSEQNSNLLTNERLNDTYSNIIDIMKIFDIKGTFAFVGAFTMTKEEFINWNHFFNNKSWLKRFLHDVEINKPIFDSFFFENEEHWKLTDSVPINTKWGIPVRFRDANDAIKIFKPPFVEFHLTYSDLNYKDYDILNISKCGIKVHAPELFAENFIIDLAVNNKKVRDISIEYMEKTVEVAHSIYCKSAQNTSLDLVINPGGHSSDNFLPDDQKPMMFENLFNSFEKIDFGIVNPVIQSMPPFPWHLGGRRYHNMFVRIDDFIKWNSLTGYKFCIDYSHSYLAAKFLNIAFEDYAKALIPYSSYYHIADAGGTDGEGLQILDGEINFKNIFDNLLNQHTFEYIPEIWQGHIDQFCGFKKALSNLRKLGW